MRWLHWNAGSSHLQRRRLEMLPRQTSTPGDGWLEAHNDRFRSEADILRWHNDVRFTPESGHLQCTTSCPLWADTVAKVPAGPRNEGKRAKIESEEPVS